MYDYLFETNKQNAYTLAEKHNLSEYDRDYIRHCFWPIIKVNNYDIETIKEKISSLKNEFIKENTIFDLKIFNRENTDYLIYSLKQFIDVLERGKVEMWDEYGDENFYIFKMESDTKDSTLIISEKTITQLEIYFKSVLNAFQDFTKEQNNIDKRKDSKKTNIDISKELNDFEVFSNDLKDETKTLFNQNISKNEALNLYYKDYLPKYLTRINELISHLEQMQNEFKLYFPELESDLEKLNAINSKFKKSVLNDFEITLNKVLNSDYERFLFEYLNITNKLEIDLEIEGKKISDFFKLFYNRILHIKSNPKPPEAIAEKQKSNFIQVLPKFSDVFFVHYQCDDFEIGNKIISLSIYADGKTIEFFTNNEIENIEKYCNKVSEFCNRGLIPVHWGQDRTHYGNEHIKNRYNELTGKIIELEYTNSINLGNWLVDNYGENYISHPRLDSLAKLNEFNGITDKESRIFYTNRILLLTKIYHNVLKGTLKTEIKPLDFPDTSTVEKSKPKKIEKLKKPLFDFVQNVKDKETFLQELKTTFTTEKGKSIKIIITLLEKESILIINSREFKDFHLELQSFFDRNIGSRQSVNDVKFDDIHLNIIEPIQKKLNPLIIKYKAI